jgi:hypothetical protein
MLHISTSDWTQARGCDGLLLERLSDWVWDYCCFVKKFGDRHDLARGLRILSRMQRQLVKIAMLERIGSTLH